MTVSLPQSKTGSQNKTSLSKTTSIHILITALENEVMSSGGNTHGQGRNNHHQHHTDGHASQGYHRGPRRSQARGDADGHPSTNVIESAQYARRPTSSSSANGRPRTSSVSSRSPGTKERRQFRPTYSDEEVYFIWYYRIDLGYDWQDINNAYNAQFPDRPREGFGGIQCKYYRYCEEFGIPKVRHRDRGASQVIEYGMRSRTGLSYPWMRN